MPADLGKLSVRIDPELDSAAMAFLASAVVSRLLDDPHALDLLVKAIESRRRHLSRVGRSH